MTRTTLHATLARAFAWAAVFSASVATVAALAEEPRIELRPLTLGAFQELGAVYNGLHTDGGGNGVVHGTQWVDHFGAFLAAEAVVDDRLHLRGGLGGVFQFRKPETVGSGFSFHQRKAFFLGPARTEAVYHFGEDPRSPWLMVGTGMFPYKYNPDVSNLGEYLFRSRAYPTILNTGGYVFIGSAGATLQGFQANLRKGNLKADALLVTETELAPFYDWSLALVASYSVADGLLDVGAGVNFQHLIPVRPSRTTAEAVGNSYFRDPVAGGYLAGNTQYYANADGYFRQKADALYANGTASDSARADRYAARADGYAAQGARADSLLALPAAQRPGLRHYTTRATLLMARAALDFKKVLPRIDGGALLGPEDLRLYTEVSVLGVRDYPVFYDNIMDRMPIMVGFNLPAFRFLDVLAVQAEHFRSPWLNNTYSLAEGDGRRVFNTPYLPGSSDEVLGGRVYEQLRRDDWKWSVMARKRVGRMTFSAQVARDHLRLPSSEFYYGPQYDPNEITTFPDSWYWATQVSWGL
jgi:hypothetical protein